MDIVVNSFDRETGEYSFIDRGITTLNQIPLRRSVLLCLAIKKIILKCIYSIILNNLN